MIKALGTNLKQHHYDAATSMVFNCGARSLKWNWAKAIKRGDIEAAAKHLRKTAVTAGGKRLSGLVKRRAMEAEILLNANYGRARGAKAKQPTSTMSPLLQRGSQDESVRALQIKLKKVGYPVGVVDGIYGSLTVQAVLAFQETKGLNIDGKVQIGGETWGALDAAIAKGWTRDLGNRAKATRRDLPQSRIVEAANKGSGLVTIAGAAGIAGVSGDTLGLQVVADAQEWLSGATAFGLDWLHCGLMGSGGYLYWQLRQAGQARIDDHRKGRTI